MARNSVTAADDIDSGVRGTVARRPCQGRGWATAITAQCTCICQWQMLRDKMYEKFLLQVLRDKKCGRQ
ncbi:hypothetical protein Y032_0638g975 [Ancylostoma ceylanicum]|uniref:Uncharacterized protein n=1 Tax=Ancylostoma ceylanicum TaxID=53326 RepID=A0A016WJ62_9BILA|nr:hypothetical protein Y032_0638g975 [Ancylostoma ceylanicum]